MTKSTTVTVRILDRDYEVSCAPEEVGDLLRAASSLSVRMQEIQQSGKVVGLDRVAVMAALNYANEFLEMKDRLARFAADTDERAGRIADRVTATLERRRPGPGARHA